MKRCIGVENPVTCARNQGLIIARWCNLRWRFAQNDELLLLRSGFHDIPALLTLALMADRHGYAWLSKLATITCVGRDNRDVRLRGYSQSSLEEVPPLLPCAWIIRAVCWVVMEQGLGKLFFKILRTSWCWELKTFLALTDHILADVASRRESTFGLQGCLVAHDVEGSCKEILPILCCHLCACTAPTSD